RTLSLRIIISCRSRFSHKPSHHHILIDFLLTRVSEFARGISALQPLHLAVFHDKLKNNVGKLRRAELQAFHRNQLLWRPTRENQRKSCPRLIHHLKFHLAWRQVRPRQLLQHFGIQRLRLARENYFCLVQRNHRLIRSEERRVG